MAMSKGASTYNRQMWEDSEFPILCQTCLGDNPYIRMTKELYGKECKICCRPFTVFRWCPGARMRFKKTEVCQTCSKLKNVCQTCLLDLEYGLPIQVRDTALKIKDHIPRSDVNKEYYVQNVGAKLDMAVPGEGGGKAGSGSDILMKLARTAPYYKRNRPHICSFWVKGNCRRGEECPYRHEKPTDPDDPLADQNIKDRYFGVNDPVAEKLMKRVSVMPKLEPPEDKTVTTLYVGNIGPTTTEKDLRDVFYQFGEIRQIIILSKMQCAFVEYVRRSDAELAAEKTYNMLIIDGRRIYVKWKNSQSRRSGNDEGGSHVPENDPEAGLKPSKNLPTALPPLPKEVQSTDYFNLASTVTIPPPQLNDIIAPPIPPSFPPPIPHMMPHMHFTYYPQ